MYLIIEMMDTILYTHMGDKQLQHPDYVYSLRYVYHRDNLEWLTLFQDTLHYPDVLDLLLHHKIYQLYLWSEKNIEITLDPYHS